jgi:hypothetical protein
LDEDENELIEEDDEDSDKDENDEDSDKDENETKLASMEEGKIIEIESKLHVEKVEAMQV